MFFCKRTKCQDTDNVQDHFCPYVYNIFVHPARFERQKCLSWFQTFISSFTILFKHTDGMLPYFPFHFLITQEKHTQTLTLLNLWFLHRAIALVNILSNLVSTKSLTGAYASAGELICEFYTLSLLTKHQCFCLCP